jgi:cytochrome c-type biogenesis protein CcmE
VTRRAKIIRNAAILMPALLMILLVVAALATQTAWFRAYLERKIVAAAEESTGGRVDLGGLAID